MVKRGSKKFYWFEQTKRVDGIGGVSYAGTPSGEAFKGKLQPVQVRNEFSMAGFNFTADYVLICTDAPAIKLLDGIARSENRDNIEYVVVGIKKYENHIEFMLEQKAGKGALI